MFTSPSSLLVVLLLSAVTSAQSTVNGPSGSCPASGSSGSFNGQTYCCPGSLVVDGQSSGYCCVGGGTNVTFPSCFPFCSGTADVPPVTVSTACITTIPITASNYAALASAAYSLTSSGGSAATTVQGSQQATGAASQTSAKSSSSGSAPAPAATSTANAAPRMVEDTVVALAAVAAVVFGVAL